MKCKGNDYIVALVVPGRDDRIFYKTFFKRLADLLSTCCGANMNYVDLDSSEYRGKKQELLEQVVPGVRGLGKWAALSLTDGHGRSVNILIGLPIEAVRDVHGRVGGKDPVAATAAVLMGILIVKQIPNFKLLVVADDAEQSTFKDRLQRLENNVFDVHLRQLLERIGIDVKRSVVSFDATSYYYKLLDVDVQNSGYSFRVLMLVQGLEPRIVGSVFEPLAQTNRRALEDFIVYAAKERVSQIPAACIDVLQSAGSQRLHKKIVRLLALMLCRHELENAMDSLLGVEGVRRLLSVHSGLERLAGEVAALLGCCSRL